jgi:hypothetical protein
MNARIPLVIGLILLAGPPGTAAPLGTEFLYQGRLAENHQPASGNYDLTFTLLDAASGGSTVGRPLTNLSVTVNDGLFSAPLDFGAVFDGSAYWLEVAVRSSGDPTVAFTTLNPRQPVGTAPYALFAPTAGSANGVAANAVTAAGLQDATITAAKVAPLQVVKSLNSLKDDVQLVGGAGVILATEGNTLTVSSSGGSGWSLAGNAGTTPGDQFVGTTDAQPLELRVNGQRALRLEPGSGPNVIGGSPANSAGPGVRSATIGGGGGWELQNTILANFGTIGGGSLNLIEPGADQGTIAGGQQNTIERYANGSSLGGGAQNRIEQNSSLAVIGGGLRNAIGLNSQQAFIGGGQANWVKTNALAAVIAGGQANLIGDRASYAVIGGGYSNALGTWAMESFIGSGTRNVIGEGGANSVIGGGFGNTAEKDAWETFIGGGEYNRIGEGSRFAAVLGGHTNTIAREAEASTIGGGRMNRIEAGAAFAAIPGGEGNVAAGPHAFAAGRQAQALHEGSFVWSDAAGGSFPSITAHEFAVRALGGVRIETGANGLSVNGRKVALLDWQSVDSGWVDGAPNRGYLLLSGAEGVTLPATAGVGDVVRVAGVAAGWKIGCSTGSSILNNLTLPSAGRAWIPRGPTAGWIGVACSADGRTIFAAAGTPENEVQRSTDLGLTWTTVNAPEAAYSDIACSADGRTVLATGFYTSYRTYLSRDAGTNWTEPSLPDGGSANRVACSGDGNTLVAYSYAFAHPFYVSGNGGGSWTAKDGTNEYYQIACSGNGSTLLAIRRDSTLQLSSNGGDTWTAVDPRPGFSLALDHDGSFWGVVDGNQAGFSRDRGGSWTTARFDDWVNRLACSRLGDRLAASTYQGRLHFSEDYGMTWTTEESIRDWQDVAISSDGLLAVACATGDRIYIRDDRILAGLASGLEALGPGAVEFIYAGNGVFLPLSFSGRFSAF